MALAIGMAGAVFVTIFLALNRDVMLRTWDEDLESKLIRNGILAILGLILLMWSILAAPLTL